MSERDDYPHGVPCWVTNLAPDVRAATGFYGELFGWSFQTDEATGYAVARLRDRDVAGIGSLAEAAFDARPAWITEVRVDSADAAVQGATRAGGTLLARSEDLVRAGRLGVIADPLGAVFGVWEANTRKGAQVVNEAGAWSMSSLRTPDAERAAAFYGAMFGWQREAFGAMTMWRSPGYVGGEEAQPVPRDVVAVMEPPDPGADARWGVDFWVADAAAAASTAERRGGRVLTPPTDTGPFRSATLCDPAGAAFNVSQLLQDA